MGIIFDKKQRQTKKAKEQDMEKERTQNKVQKEDFLLNQIDEFKEKAKQLQGLLLTKENKVEELQGVLAEREERAKQLQSVLDQHKKEADKLIQVVQAQINALIARVDDQLKSMDENVSSEIDSLDERFSEQVTELNSNSRQQMAEIDKQFQHFSKASEEKSQEQAEMIKASLEEISVKLEDAIKNMEAIAELPQKQVEDKLGVLKAELGEKVHSENVKCYRNIQTLVEELEKRIDSKDTGAQSLNAMKGYFGALILLSVVNIAGLAAVIARMFGFF
ncbi:MAG: hypothetical protein HFI71_03895 [Lachnospiraceae bacterium]|jgi:Chromosome segregation ATPases|nr:hypothetical protein [Lachnospiraceae bacterium]